MDDMSLLIDFHIEAERQGPGSDEETLRALSFADLDETRPLQIADIGCGTGAASLVLAKKLHGTITAVDMLSAFLDKLESRAVEAGVADRIQTMNASMDSLSFGEGALDLLWSEGAIYNMGFEAGVAAWHRFLKPGGYLVASEITWLTKSRPEELRTHWEAEYPEINAASSKMDVLERYGYSPQAYFVLPANCWWNNYYGPMEKRFDRFLARHGHSQEARALVAREQAEIALYRKYSAYYGYGVYVARKSISS